MFKLNRKVEYALISLKHMSHKRPGEISTAKEISESYGCSFDVIARVLQVLSKKNWLQSTQGASGGYLLVRDLAKVSFYDLLLLILGPINLVRCLSSSCQIKRKCNIVSPAQNLNDSLVEFYKSLSLFSLLGGVTSKGSTSRIEAPPSEKRKRTPAPHPSSPPTPISTSVAPSSYFVNSTSLRPPHSLKCDGLESKK